MDATNVIVSEPLEKIWGSVRFPKEAVVPHSNHPAEETPPGTRVPFKVAEFGVTAVASFVVAEAVLPVEPVLVCEYPASTPNDNAHTNIPKHRANLIVLLLWHPSQLGGRGIAGKKPKAKL